jgi:hypothetical protein
MTDQDTTPPSVPPHLQLIRTATAYWESKLLLEATRLGLADHLSDGARSSDDLARE